MRKIDESKLAKLSTTNKMLDDKYGTHGAETRNEFDEQSLDIALSTLNSKFTKPLTRFAYRNPLGVTAPQYERPIAAKLVDNKTLFCYSVFYRLLSVP